MSNQKQHNYIKKSPMEKKHIEQKQREKSGKFLIQNAKVVWK